MEENKQITTRHFTDDEIMEAIINLNAEDKEAILSFDFNSIRIIANDPTKATEYMNSWLDTIKRAERLCNAVYMISLALHNSEKSTELVMDKMTENYKAFSNENKLKFSERIMAMNDVEVSTELFKNTWRKFINHIGIRK